MQNIVNRRWFLKQYPEGMPTLDNWTMDEQRVPDPGPGQILVKAKWLSVDPYMRGRMSPATNYTKGVEIGELMQGGGVGEVVASNHPKWKAGDIADRLTSASLNSAAPGPVIQLWFPPHQEQLANWWGRSPS